jgi:hypothetical protein
MVIQRVFSISETNCFSTFRSCSRGGNAGGPPCAVPITAIQGIVGREATYQQHNAVQARSTTSQGFDPIMGSTNEVWKH